MRSLLLSFLMFCICLSCLMLGTASAQNVPSGSSNNQNPDMTSDPLDPVVELQRIQARRTIAKTRRDSLFSTSPLTPIRAAWLRAETRLGEATGIQFGTAVNHLMQQLDRSLPGEDTFGMSTNMTLVGTWGLYDVGGPKG